MQKGVILPIYIFELFVLQTLSLSIQSKAIGESFKAQKSIKNLGQDQQNFRKEMVNRKKCLSPFFFKSFEFQDTPFQKEEQEKTKKQREVSFQIRKNTKFNNGLRRMEYQRKEQRLSKIITNSSGKFFNESTQIQNLGKEIISRKKRHSPFFFKSLEFQDSTFEKQEREKKQKQKEMSVQLRKNAKFNNGLRWMGYQRKEQRLFEMVTNSTGKDFNESNQLGVKELCENPNKKNIRHLIEKCHQFSLKKLYHFKEASTGAKVARVRRVPMFLKISRSNVIMHSSTRNILRSNVVKPRKTSPRWIRLI